MRISTRDKRTFWYALYLGKTEKTETIGTGQSAQTIRLGEYEISYVTPQMAIGYVSIPRGTAMSASGNAEIREYGVDTEYRRYVFVEGAEGITSLNVDSVMWIDRDPAFDKDSQPTFDIDPDYRVTRVAHSLNHTIYEVKKYNE